MNRASCPASIASNQGSLTHLESGLGMPKRTGGNGEMTLAATPSPLSSRRAPRYRPLMGGAAKVQGDRR